MSTYKYETNMTSPYSSPRAGFGHGSKVTGITIHHWGVDGQTHDGVVRYLCSRRPVNPTSAHYVTSAGRVSCIVDPDLAAWHSGNARGNGTTIGIECRPEMSPGDWATLVELCADLEGHYGSLQYWAHYNWSNTSCPGRYGPRMAKLIDDVNAELRRRRDGGGKAGTPTSKGRRTHTVSPGDTLWAIGQRYNVSVAKLRQRNPKVNPDALQVGDVLQVD